MGKELIVLFATNGFKKYPDSLTNLKRFLNENFSNHEIHLYILNNGTLSEFPQTLKIPQGYSVEIAVPNDVGEFSAWQFGLKYVSGKYTIDTELVLVNSAFQNGFSDYIQTINDKLQNRITSSNFAVGHLEYLDKPHRMRTHRIQNWIRSSFIYSNLASFLSITKLTETLSGEEEHYLFGHLGKTEDQESMEYIDYLRGWITGEVEHQGSRWHSSIDLDENSRGSFLLKSNSILSEHLLTSKLTLAGIPIYDPGYIFSNREFQIQPATWHFQIKSRPYGLKLKGSNLEPLEF
jgi:hypothetical protein